MQIQRIIVFILLKIKELCLFIGIPALAIWVCSLLPVNWLTLFIVFVFVVTIVNACVIVYMIVCMLLNWLNDNWREAGRIVERRNGLKWEANKEQHENVNHR